ncbi:MAG: hypothetical protein ACKVS6_13785 [Planctomycetota bacterium]
MGVASQDGGFTAIFWKQTQVASTQIAAGLLARSAHQCAEEGVV